MLDLLAAQPVPVTAADLAAATGQHPNTVREHLDALVEEGFATREIRPPEGRGRPAWLYAAAPVRAETSEYAGLASALASQIARSSAHPTADALAAGASWGQQLATRRGSTPRSAAAARREVVELLDDLGFDPGAGNRVRTVQLRRCPLLEAAKAQPDVVCAVHLGLVRGALQSWGAPTDGTALEPFAEPGACVLHVTGAPRSAQ